MNKQTITLAMTIAFFIVFLLAPRAEAEPLTAMAVIGVTTVAVVALGDQVLHEHEDDRDMRGKQEKQHQEKEVRAETAEAEPTASAEAGTAAR